MNYRMILSLLGNVLLIIAAFLLLPCIVALIYGEDALIALLLSIAVCGGAGVLLSLLRPKKNRTIHAREGFVMVSLAWIFISLGGALPFRLSGAIPSYLDAVFEMVSGFTSTGASILRAVEDMPKCLLFWRSFSHWLGGMGVLVFMLAIVPLSGESIHLLRAESPGPSVSKMLPKMRDSSAILYGIYLGMTVLQILAYRLGTLCGWGDISWFDTLCLSFGSAGTGGFSIRNDGMASYSTYELWVTTVSMALFGVNFSVYFFLLFRKPRTALKNSEVKCYFLIILIAVALITANLLLVGGYFDSFGQTVREVSFAVSSLITTTGYGSADFSLWPEFSKTVLAFLMLVGACGGSTGGGLKVSRLLILLKTARMEIRRLLHPQAVTVMKLDGKPVSKEIIRSTSAYFIFYCLIILAAIFVISLDGFGTETTVTAAISVFNNIGPGLSTLIGPCGSFADFSALSKLVLIGAMLLGRLEIFPMLLLLRPATWRKY